jgi:hypothetical protein
MSERGTQLLQIADRQLSELYQRGTRSRSGGRAS